jgi:hypothetical protein
MPVNSLNPDYEINLDSWQTIRDVMLGESAIKRAGARYVPRLEGQSDVEFRAFVDRGFFYNATARTVSGYLGMIFRREPVVKLPERSSACGKALQEFVNDVDLMGKGIEEYARQVVSEVTVMGRCGTLADWVLERGNKGEENRAYVSLYRAEDILNWREERINGRLQLTLVVLREMVSYENTPRYDGSNDDPPLDPFVTGLREQFRVLRLVDRQQGAAPNGAETWHYIVEIWGKDGDGKVVLLETRVPVRRGKPLPNIPFVFHGPQFSRPSVEPSPIADIVAANLDHYRMNVEFKHGMHYTALPTAWVSGFEKDTVLRIGSSTAWVTDTIGASAGFLEFKGDGLRTFERAMDRVERLLAVLGARLLESQKRVSESAEALQMRQAGDSSVIAGLAVAVSKSLNQALHWVYWWHSIEYHPDQISSEEIMVEINRDFDVVRLTGKEIQALIMAWQSMAISQDTLLHQFERGDVLPPGRSPEEELALIKANPPPQTSKTTNVLDRGEAGYG